MSVQVPDLCVEAYGSPAYRHFRSTDFASNLGDSGLLSAQSPQDSEGLYDPVSEHSKDTARLSQAQEPHDVSVAPGLGSTDESQIEDHAHWISSLIYICPNLQSFVTDSDLEEVVEPGSSDIDSEELVAELIEDLVDTVQQLYDLGGRVFDVYATLRWI